MKTLKQFVEEASETYGDVRTDYTMYVKPKCGKRLPDWVRGMIQEAWKAGEKAEFHRLRKKSEDFRRSCDGLCDGRGFIADEVETAIFGKEEKKPGQCEYPWCDNKATWCVCAKNGRGVKTCGKHKAGKGLTLDMRKIKVKK